MSIFIRYFFITVLLCLNAYCQASPLTIVPSTTLPTEILPDGEVTAYYTVTNNTSSLQSGIFVRKFPNNTTQVLVDPSITDLCGATFSLQSGASCTLELLISGPVHAGPNDLLVCLSDGSSCACANNLLNVEKAALTAVGVAITASGSSYIPLAYTSKDGGNNWLLSSGFNHLPADKTQGELLGVSCEGDRCSAVGFAYTDDFVDNIPLGYTSTDGGKHWSGPATFPATASGFQGNLYNVSCVGNQCVAVGESINSADHFSLLAYNSTDGGKAWTLSSTSAPTDLGSDGYGSFYGVDCNNNYCVAVGAAGDIDGNNQFPIAYTSTNGGDTWHQSTSHLPTPIPVGGPQTQALLNGVDCQYSGPNLYCVAVGYAFSSTTQNGIGIAYYSNDGGNTWTLSPAGFTSPLSFPQLELGSIACTGLKCSAVGQFSSAVYDNFSPAAYSSPDGGITWNLSVSTPLSLPALQSEGGLFGVTCIGKTCIALGSSFTSEGNILPLSYISPDNGNTWELSNSSDVGFALPSGFTQGLLDGAN